MVTEVEEEHFNKYEDVASLDERQEFGMEEDACVEQQYKICITIMQGWPLLSKRKYAIFVPGDIVSDCEKYVCKLIIM